MDALEKTLQEPTPERPKEKIKVFYRKNAAGLVEAVELATGLVVAIQKDMRALERSVFTPAIINGREVLIQSGVEKADLTIVWEYNHILADVVCQQIALGKSLSDLGKEQGMPDAYTIALWRKQYPDFDEKYQIAKQVRAEMLRDEAMQRARNADGRHKDEIAGVKLAVETAQWAAEKDDPMTYGSRVKVEGRIGLVQMVVETGIRRVGDPGVETAEDAEIIAMQKARESKPQQIEGGAYELPKKEGGENDSNSTDGVSAEEAPSVPTQVTQEI